ncbi:MAG TPA: hypothetical protein VIV66_05585 [Pyrinomonadaceae bacterium]
MQLTIRLLVCSSFVLIVIGVQAQTGYPVCANPQAPCQHKNKEFAPYELSFRLPAKLRKNADYKSAPFYAVVLKTYKDFEAGGDGCDGGEFSTAIETERKAAQKLFSAQKVFASYQCPDMAAVQYVSGSKNLNDTFLAVFGGVSQAAAQLVLEKARARYPGATLERMQALYNWIYQ